jgi:long-chain acyl-CoA synthetase
MKIADKLIFSKWREALGGSARLVGCGGASLQPRLESIFWASGLKIINMYGLTETSPIITINRQEKGSCKLGTVGSVIEGVEVKIAGDGEVLCRGHCVMLGYYKDEELTRSVMDKEGWFHTGDVGHLLEDKFLVITDRKKEIFKLSSGKFVAPQPIENRIKESLFIDQAMVVGEHQNLPARCCSRFQIPGKSGAPPATWEERSAARSWSPCRRVISEFNEEIKRSTARSGWERINRIGSFQAVVACHRRALCSRN